MEPRVLVLSSLFPSAALPQAGLFVRERMFRVARRLPIVVLAPQPWFPFQGFVRRWRADYRPPKAAFEVQDGVRVLRPRFLALPAVLRRCDGFFMALACLRPARQVARESGVDVIDAHFGYPDGYAATLLGRWLAVPVTITLRGTEPAHGKIPALRHRLVRALRHATRVFAVADSLHRFALELGAPPDKVRVVGNGVDLDKFYPMPRDEARRALDLPVESPVLIGVGGLVERKGFHRVLDCLPSLAQRFPGIRYVIVGGGSPEGDETAALRAQAQTLGVADRVLFTGPLPPDRLRQPLSACDVFVLATRNEGWANVFLEAMACGLPVVTTDVGGNREVVCREELGTVVPFGDAKALEDAIAGALEAPWQREAIIAYARENTWDRRIDVLVDEFRSLARKRQAEALA
ncbi:MAG: glycosyltransferase [Burkholderiales bacterium]|nr:glycosyltransferase [Burkholderiales bacterium]